MSEQPTSETSESTKAESKSRLWVVGETVLFVLLLGVGACTCYLAEIIEWLPLPAAYRSDGHFTYFKSIAVTILAWSWLFLSCWGASRLPLPIPSRIFTVLGILIPLWYWFVYQYGINFLKDQSVAGISLHASLLESKHYWLPLAWTFAATLCAVWGWGIQSNGRLMVRLSTTIASTFVLLYLMTSYMGSFTESATSAFLWNQTFIFVTVVAFGRFYFGHQITRETEPPTRTTSGRRFGLGSLLLVMTTAAAVMAMARYFELINTPTSFRARFALTALLPAIALRLLWMGTFTQGVGKKLALITFTGGLACLAPVVTTIVMRGTPKIPQLWKMSPISPDSVLILAPGFGFNEFGRSTHWTAWWTAGCLLYTLPWLFFLRNCGYRLADQAPTTGCAEVSVGDEFAASGDEETHQPSDKGATGLAIGRKDRGWSWQRNDWFGDWEISPPGFRRKNEACQ